MERYKFASTAYIWWCDFYKIYGGMKVKALGAHQFRGSMWRVDAINEKEKLIEATCIEEDLSKKPVVDSIRVSMDDFWQSFERVFEKK